VTLDRDFSREERELVAGARRGLAPGAEDAARVLNRARLAIASGVADPAAMAQPSALKAALTGTLAKNVAVWTAAAVVSAVLGYNAGFVVGERRAREQTAPAHAPPAPAPRDEVRTAAPVLTPRPQEQPIAAGPAMEPPVVLKPRASSKAAPAPIAEPVATPVEPATTAASSSLDVEIKTLRIVERALRNREPSRALELLTQLDRDVAQGQMLEERAAARAVASCEARAAASTVDRAELMQIVLEFSQHYPASVYFARVRKTCLGTIDRATATDSAPR